MTTTHTRLRTLIECALMVALGTILAQIKLFDMPFGGSVTLLSMLPFILISFRHGVKWGLFTGFINSLLQMMMGFYPPPANTVLAYVGVVLYVYLLPLRCSALPTLLQSAFLTRRWALPAAPFGPARLRFLCSFLVRRAAVGQLPKLLRVGRGLECLGVQPDLQRHLHAAGSHSHCAGRCFAGQSRTAFVPIGNLKKHTRPCLWRIAQRQGRFFLVLFLSKCLL